MLEPEDLTPIEAYEPLEVYVTTSGLNAYAYAGNRMSLNNPKRYWHAALIVSTSTIVPQTILAIFRPRK